MKILVQTLAVCLIFFIAIPLGAVLAFGSLPDTQAEIGYIKGEDAAAPQNKVKLPKKIKVWKENEGKTVSVDFEEYVACVTASEMPNTFESEALKAQSVAARTFAVAKIEKYEQKKPVSHPSAPICSSTHCQVYKTEKELKDATRKAGQAQRKALRRFRRHVRRQREKSSTTTESRLCSRCFSLQAGDRPKTRKMYL